MTESPNLSPSSSDAIRAGQASHSSQPLQNVVQQVSDMELGEFADPIFSPIAIARRFTPLREKTKKEEAEKAEKNEKIVTHVQRLAETAERFNQKNPEFAARSLILLRARIQPGDSKEQILEKVLQFYPDYSLADEALDFLLETSDGELFAEITAAKEDLNARFTREIRAGKNMSAQAREFADKGLGAPTNLRNLYREITGNPRDPLVLFDELSSQFAFDKLETVIDFVFHSLGSDLRSKGPSIARAELHRLMTESRTLGAILGVYRFFYSRMKLITSSFARAHLLLPSTITFEVLAKLFVRFLQERYPNLEKALQLAKEMGIEDDLLAAMIIYTQMRDGTRNVGLRLFKNENHRQEVLRAFLQTLEKLEDDLEKEEEKEEEENDKEEPPPNDR